MERLTLENAINRSRKLAERHRWNSENTKLETSDENANQIYKNTCIQYANQEDQYAKWFEELKAYKDLEEQGLLVRLPANKNKEIYIISSRWTVCSECGSRFDEYSCIGCEYECDSEKEYYVCPTYLSSINVDAYANQFGKTVFLTREEAEKKLEVMNGK
jgi:hypothetical protein